jgi:RAD50-interacting protein 1
MGEVEEDGALFDEMIAAYAQRRKAAQDLLVSALANSHSKAFRNYTSRAQFSTVGDTAVIGRRHDFLYLLVTSIC